MNILQYARFCRYASTSSRFSEARDVPDLIRFNNTGVTETYAVALTLLFWSVLQLLQFTLSPDSGVWLKLYTSVIKSVVGSCFPSCCAKYSLIQNGAPPNAYLTRLALMSFPKLTGQSNLLAIPDAKGKIERLYSTVDEINPFQIGICVNQKTPGQPI